MKNVQIYNHSAVFASHLSSGFHYLDSQGNFSNSTSDVPLLFPITRVNQVNFSFGQNRTEIKSLGNRNIIKRALLSQSDVNLSLNYFQLGLCNEQRIGLLCNIRSGSQTTGKFLYGDGRVCPISGLFDRKYEFTNASSFGLPLSTTEPKNYFIGVTKNNNSDFNDISAATNPKNSEINVYGFGDCFLTNYKTAGGVGTIPYVSLEFTCSNVEMYSSGSSNGIPAVNPRTLKIYSGTKFSIPNNYDGSNLPTVLIPRDITLTIKTTNKANPDNLMVNFNDIKVQNYDLGFSLTRENLYNITYKGALDRPINFPVICSLNLSLLPGDLQSGSLSNLTLNDETYDVTLKLNYQSNQGFTGIAIQYDFLGGNFNNMSYSQSVQGHQTANLSLSVPMDPEDLNKGFFISGQLGIPDGTWGEVDLSAQDGNLLKFQNNNIFAISLASEKLLY